MKFNLPKILFLIGLLNMQLPGSFAQDGSATASQQQESEKKIQFNGLGRAIINNTSLGGDLLKSDTTTAEKLTDGEFLLDLAVNAQPNDKTEVQGILRLRNEFGGFFGAGVTVEVRELWARGIIANAIKYRVGDFDHVMTPYTFFNPDEEGMVNEPAVFGPQKDVIYYEQFYQDGNTRRLQGANLEFGLDFPVFLDEMKVEGFLARLRGTDFISTPTRFTGGGRVDFATQTLQDSMGLKAKAGFNLSNTWDDLQSGDATSGIRNLVWSVDFDITVLNKKNLGIHVVGEAGRSALKFIQQDSFSVFDKGDSFMDVGVMVKLKPSNLTLSVSYVDIGPDFFSSAAQSKRVDFNRRKTFFNRIGNERRLRMPTLFDLSRDRALYTFQLSDRLMPYDPRYANVMPYGNATPNRSGLKFGIKYGDAESNIEAGLDAAFLKEIRGQGTFELKNLRQIRATANFNFHKMMGWEKTMRATFGLQNEQATRGGVEVEKVDLGSTLIETGIEAELFSRFDLLLGAKFLSANGSDYVPLVEEYNEIKDFPARYVADDKEALLGAGFKYRFAEGVYLTLQYQQFTLKRANDASKDYDLKQFFVLYNMEF